MNQISSERGDAQDRDLAHFFEGWRQSEKSFKIRTPLKALQNSFQLSTYLANKLDTKVKLKFFARKWNEELCS